MFLQIVCHYVWGVGLRLGENVHIRCQHICPVISSFVMCVDVVPHTSHYSSQAYYCAIKLQKKSGVEDYCWRISASNVLYVCLWKLPLPNSLMSQCTYLSSSAHLHLSIFVFLQWSWAFCHSHQSLQMYKYLHVCLMHAVALHDCARCAHVLFVCLLFHLCTPLTFCWPHSLDLSHYTNSPLRSPVSVLSLSLSVYVCVHTCVHACVRVWVSVCVRACVCVHRFLMLPSPGCSKSVHLLSTLW